MLHNLLVNLGFIKTPSDKMPPPIVRPERLLATNASHLARPYNINWGAMQSRKPA